jgi:PadR family transcriptional regulator AphA
MSLRFALLGLLAVQPASGYDLKRAINRSTYFIWNATGPQIYSSGRAALKEFMGKPIRASVTRDEVLLRIFFGNFASRKTIKRELEAYLDRIGKERATMEATEARINANPGGKHEARRFQLLSLRIKVAQIRAMEQELTRFLADGSDKSA